MGLKVGNSQQLAALDADQFRQCVAAAQDGCSESLGRALGECQNYLLAVANAECPRDLAGKIAPSDLVQDTLLEAQRDFQQFGGDRQEQMLAWLNCILRNNMLNAIRRYRLTGRSLVDPAPGPRSWVIAQEETWHLEQALDRLPNDYRQAVLLRSWHQLPFAEVGLLMNRSPEAARKLWTRAIRNLYEELKELGADVN